MTKPVLYSKSGNYQISRHLRSTELMCKCSYDDCKFISITNEAINSFEKTRLEYGLPIYVTSGHRCFLHNSDVGGVINSNHVLGDALDLSPSDGNIEKLIEIARKNWKYVLPYKDNGFIHCDNRLNREIKK